MIGPRLFPTGLLQLAIALANDVNALTIVVLMWAVLTRPTHFWSRILNHPAAIGLGVISYSVYLWHQPIVAKQTPVWMHSFPLNLVCILFVATLSYRLIEKPFLSWKDRVGSVGRTRELSIGDGPPRLKTPLGWTASAKKAGESSAGEDHSFRKSEERIEAI